MGRLFIVALAVFGAFILIGLYAPGLMREGFTVSGHKIAWSLLVLGGVGYIAYKAK